MEENTQEETKSSEKKLVLTIYSKDINKPFLYNLPEGSNPTEEIGEFLKGRYVYSNEQSSGWYINPQAITLITVGETKTVVEEDSKDEVVQDTV